ncbi:MAG: hypothetical protein LUH03_04320 [Oscillospiraceae bacterium]|nr:hypothetical protein [Oscillospiraceae bacterium]
MSFTPGQLLFYGGLLGIAVTAIITIIVIIVLAGSRKRLRKKLNEEYGVSPK